MVFGQGETWYSPCIVVIPRSMGTRGPDDMDSILMILFASLICTMTALTFMEVRRIRKKIDQRTSEAMHTKTAA